jgi:hypothetical protein
VTCRIHGLPLQNLQTTKTSDGYPQRRVGKRLEENGKARLSIMSDLCSDHFSDLLCGEGSEILLGESPECSSDLDSGLCIDESIAEFIEDEKPTSSCF